MTTYDSAAIYIESQTALADKITAIDNIIMALELTALTAAGNGGYTEYYLDDGQTKISAKYRGPKDIAAAITAFEGIRQRYINRLNGRVARLVDGKNFTGWC